MPEDQPVQNVKAIVNLTSDIIKIAKENPEAQEAGQYAAKSLKIISQTVHSVLLPLAVANFAITRFADYMQNKFGKELSDLTRDVPPEHLIVPKAAVAGPALQALAFTLEEPSLKDMYLNLIATAMDERISEKAHPAFVEVVKQLDGKEANTLKSVLGGSEAVGVVEVRTSTEGWQVLERNLIDLTGPSGEPAVSPQYAVWIDNWLRLGLFEVSFMSFLSAPDSYDWVEGRPEFLRHKTDDMVPTFARGVLRRTGFGGQFADAIGATMTIAAVEEIPSPQPAPVAETPTN